MAIRSESLGSAAEEESEAPLEITEVRVSPAGSKEDKLKAFCSVTFDNCFVVRDIRVIEGSKGLFIAMPSRKLTVRCPGCNFKNVVRSNYCNQCGGSIERHLSDQVEQGRSKLHADVAHPILTEFREEIQDHVLDAFENFLEESGVYESGRAEEKQQIHARETSSVEKSVSQIPAPRGPLEDIHHEEASEAEFLGKTESEEEEKEESLPPPEDNFSTGII